MEGESNEWHGGFSAGQNRCFDELGNFYNEFIAASFSRKDKEIFQVLFNKYFGEPRNKDANCEGGENE